MSENEGTLTRQGALGCQRNNKNSHQGLVGHGIDDGANNGLLVPLPGDPAIKKVGDACISKEAKGPRMVVVKDGVADEWRGDEPRKGQDVRDGVDVLAWGRKRGKDTAQAGGASTG